MKKIYGILCVLLFAVSISVSAGAEQINMIRNPGFEAATSASDWAKLTDNVAVDSTTSNSGNRSLKITGTETAQFVMSNMIPIDNTKSYKLSASIKTDEISTSDGAYVMMQQIDADNNSLGMGAKRISVGGTQDWANYSTDITTFNENTAFVRVYFYVGAEVTGTAWVDDISLVHEKNFVKNSSFETAISTADWAKRTGTHEIDTTVAYTGSNSVKFTSGDANSYYMSADITIDPDKQYIFSSRIKTTDVSSNGAYIKFQPYNSTTSAWASMFTVTTTGGTQDWTEYTYEYTPASGITKIRIYIYLGKNAGGYAWYDDITLTEKVTDNYIPNSGFETPTSASDWAKLTDNVAIDSTTSNSGNNSLKITGAEASGYIMSKMIAIDNTKAYKLSASIKTDEISTSDGAYVMMQQIDADNKNLGMGPKRISVGGTQDWTNYSTDITTFNENTAYVRVYFYVGAEVTGTAWVDDISLKEINLIKISADTSTWTTGNVTCNITSGETDDGIILIGAVYQNEQMVDFIMKKYSCIYEGTEKFRLSLNLPEDGQNYSVKIMALKDLLSAMPKCKSFDYISSVQ